jgi:hypothetical protein
MAKSKSQAQSKIQLNTQPKENITNSEKKKAIAKPEKKNTRKKKVSNKNDNILKIRDLQQKLEKLESALTQEQNKVANLKIYLEAEQKKVIVLEQCLIEERKSRQDAIVKESNEDKSHSTPSASKRTTLKPNKRKRIITKQENKCNLCNEELLSETTTIDHIIALKYGGGNEEKNLQALCNKCHKEKSCIETKYETYIRDFKYYLPMIRQLLSA